MSGSGVSPTERFSSRVDDYVRFRPGYPPALMHWLHVAQGIEATDRVADVGAGTGISTRLWLDAGHPVVAVEPNAAMQDAARQGLAQYPSLSWTSGTAEATGLADGSVDVVSAAQAFHWFDPVGVRAEWARILAPNGMAVVFWNSRLLEGSVFLEGYEALLREFGTDYDRVAERYQDDATMQAWFGAGFRGMAAFDNTQHIDFEGMRGRLLSSSYAPQSGHSRFDAMIGALRELFAHSKDASGHVDFVYRTRVFVGTLG